MGYKKSFFLIIVFIILYFLSSITPFIYAGGKGGGGGETTVSLFQNEGEHIKIYTDKYYGWKIQPNSLLKILLPFNYSNVNCFRINSSRKFFIPSKTLSEFSLFVYFFNTHKGDKEILEVCEDVIKESIRDFIEEQYSEGKITLEVKNALNPVLDNAATTVGPETQKYLSLIYQQFRDKYNYDLLSRSKIQTLNEYNLLKHGGNNIIQDFHSTLVNLPSYTFSVPWSISEYQNLPEDQLASHYFYDKSYYSSLEYDIPIDPIRFYVDNSPYFSDSDFYTLLPKFTGDPNIDRSLVLDYLSNKFGEDNENLDFYLTDVSKTIDTLLSMEEKFEQFKELDKEEELMILGLTYVYPKEIPKQYDKAIKENKVTTTLDEQEYYEEIQDWNKEMFDKVGEAGGCGGPGQPLCAL